MLLFESVFCQKETLLFTILFTIIVFVIQICNKWNKGIIFFKNQSASAWASLLHVTLNG